MTPSLAGAAVLLAMLGATTAAHAQMDVAPPLPNVLILLDTSGSMERKPDGTLPAISSTASSTDPNQKSRWISALEVLGGGFKGYAAIQVPRDTTDFVDEYKLLNGATPVQPYDYGYYLPHYRPMANGCTPGPSVTKSWSYTNGVPPTFGATDFGWRSYVGGTPALSPLSSTVCTTATDPSQVQDTLGILTTFQSQARFGLMTFDSQPVEKTGYPSGLQNAADGVAGQWSYYPGWNGGAAAVAHGWPNLCNVSADPSSAHIYEVGARNPGAPPWEGPLIPLANSDSAATLAQVNNQIRYSMFAHRPYGATPISPMMADAYYYYRGDPNGPSNLDPQNACRGSFIILITDGFPNQDMRPGCESNTNPALANTVPLTPAVAGAPPACDSSSNVGCCPSMRAQDVAYQLANPPTGTQPIKTFVVGFAVSDDAGNPITSCATMDPVADCPPAPIACSSNSACSSVGGVCNLTPGTDGYGKCKDNRAACCTLHQIAYQGGTGKAFIATSADTLRSALVSAMSAATATTSTSRTVPVFARPTNSASGGAQYQFQSSFKVSPFGAWQGILERLRWECPTGGTSGPAALQGFNPAKGDDFAQNLNSAPASRNFRSWNGVVAGASAFTSHGSSESIRPNIDATTGVDGVDMVHGIPITGTGPGFVTSSAMTSTVMAIDPLCKPNPTDVTPNPDGCKTKYLNYALGQHQPTTSWTTREGNALGDIYHATPVNVGAPSSYIRDESYTAFRAAQAARPPMLLAATNDGLLHGFREDVLTVGQNELWAFVPPAVMPQIPAIYGGGHALLMDASPVLRDVAFAPAGTDPTKLYGRARLDVRAGKANWRSVVVGGLSSGGGYYALDVTDPVSPTFLWQLTTANKLPLFGNTPGTPAIGVVYYAESTTEQPIETPVAFLPGGGDLPWISTRSCTRWPKSGLPAGTRSSTRCFSGAAQSFTVVRLWDGKILRTFRNDPNGDGLTKTSTSTNHPIETNSPVPPLGPLTTKAVGPFAGIDSPISGAVAIYPAATGTVTTRAFVGDLDGTLWKADVSSPDPAQWKFEIFHDAFGLEGSNAATMGQPIVTPPVVTVNRLGDITTLYGTGDQNTFASTNVNQVWSVTEKVTTTASVTTFTPTANWHMRFDNGLTPTGPLTLFNEMLYFSTFSPDAAAAGACLNGSGTLWSVHYLDAESTSSTLPKPGFVLDAAGGESVGSSTAGSGYTIPTNCRVGGTSSAPTLISNQPATGGNFRCIQLDQGSIIFGVGVTSRPSCTDPASTTIGTDPYTGVSSPHTQPSAITPGSFELVVQTGPKAGTGAGGSSTKTLPRKLVAPVSQTRIDSWAAIVE